MTVLKVKGMTCNHCQQAVKEALEHVEGSQDISVDLSTGIVKIQGSAKLDELISAIEAEGYSASALA